MEPLQQKISSVTELISSEDVPAPAESPVKEKRIKRSNYEDELLPHMQPKPGTALNFTKVPVDFYPVGSSAMEITKHSIDTSYLLEQMLSTWERSAFFLYLFFGTKKIPNSLLFLIMNNFFV